MLEKIVIKQGKKLMQQAKELETANQLVKDLQAKNNALYQENKDNRADIEDLEEHKRNTETVRKNIIDRLYKLQDVSRMQVAQDYKTQQSNVLINDIIKELVKTGINN